MGPVAPYGSPPAEEPLSGTTPLSEGASASSGDWLPSGSVPEGPGTTMPAAPVGSPAGAPLEEGGAILFASGVAEGARKPSPSSGLTAPAAAICASASSVVLSGPE